MQGNVRVSPTALLTAQAWRAGGFANAELFDSRKGRVMYAGIMAARWPFWPLLPPHTRHLLPYLQLRHQAYELRMDEFRPDMVVEVAAGLSPRGLTYARRWPEVPYLELDLPDMVAAKNAHLKSQAMPQNFHLAACDILADDFIQRLPIKPAQDQKLLVITEGLLPYLSFAEKRQAWRNLHALLQLASPASRYLFECYPAERVMPHSLAARSGLKLASLLVGRRLQDNFFASDQAVIEEVQALGFRQVQQLKLQSLAAKRGLKESGSPYALFECST